MARNGEQKNWAWAKPVWMRGTQHTPAARPREQRVAVAPKAKPGLLERWAASPGAKAVVGLLPRAAAVPGSGLESRAWAERALASAPQALPQWAARCSEEQAEELFLEIQRSEEQRPEE